MVELVARARAGDDAALVAIITRHNLELRWFIAQRARSAELIDEVVQSTFVVMLDRIQFYEEAGTFSAWLRGIARNCLREELRRRQRLDSSQLDQLLTQPAPDSDSDVDEPPPELSRLTECLGKFSPRMQMLIHRRFRDRLPYALLAQQYKQSLCSITRAIQRAADELRTCLEKRQSS